jgi:hypothetical protein
MTVHDSPPTLRASSIKTRTLLYDLIVHLRRSAAETDQANIRILFETAAEVAAGLAKAFRNFEDQLPEGS